MALEPPPQDRLILCPLSPQEKCVNCSRKFRYSQGYQLEVRRGPAHSVPASAALTRPRCPGSPAQLCSPGRGLLDSVGHSTPLDARRPGSGLPRGGLTQTGGLKPCPCGPRPGLTRAVFLGSVLVLL